MGRVVLKSVWPFALIAITAGCMGLGGDDAQVGRAVLMPQAPLGPEGSHLALAVETCAAGDWRRSLLDKRDVVLGRVDLPPGHRVLRPGDLMAAEVDPQRMTVTINSKGKIDSVFCG